MLPTVCAHVQQQSAWRHVCASPLSSYWQQNNHCQPGGRLPPECFVSALIYHEREQREPLRCLAGQALARCAREISVPPAACLPAIASYPDVSGCQGCIICASGCRSLALQLWQCSRTETSTAANEIFELLLRIWVQLGAELAWGCLQSF